MATVSPFGAWLRKWRKARGLTQVELARKAGCGQSIISQYERGVRQEVGGDWIRPEPEMLERLAIALDRPVEEPRALAGYFPSPEPVTQRDLASRIQEIVSNNPGKGFVFAPNNGQPTLAVIDTAELARQIAAILKQADGKE